MAGRKRRASTSSVESVDESQIRWLQETSVVRSVAKGVPSDDWPIFELRDAVILNRDGQALENALHVDIRGPYIVRGHLIIDDASQRSRLIMRVRTTTPLEIRQSISYSIGESADGSPLIWVSGRGGWYEINPSPAYRSIYQKMCEATTLYYNLIDIYNSHRGAPKKIKRPKQSALMDELSSVFLQYAARVGDGCMFDEVIARCSEHAGFLICQFAQQENLIDWKPTAFYKWLTTEHADLFHKIDALMKTPLRISPIPSAEAMSPMPRESTSRPLEPDAKAHVSSPPQRRSRLRAASSLVPAAVETVVPRDAKPRAVGAPSSSLPPAAAEIVAPRPVKSRPIVPRLAKVKPSSKEPPTRPMDDTAPAKDDDSPFASILAAMEHVYDLLIGSKKGLAASAVVGKLYFTYKFPNYRNGTVGAYKVPAEEVLHYNAARLLQRLDKSKYEGHEIYAHLQQLSKSEFHPVAFKLSDFPVTLQFRRRKDVLRPAMAGPAAAAPGDEDSTGTDNALAPRGKGLKGPGRKPGKKSSLRPAAAAPKKRPRSQFESESESEASGAKHSHYFSDGDDAMEDAPPREADAAAQEDHQPAPAGEEPIRLVIRADKIPSAAPQGPDDTWVCDQDDCDYIVRGGDEAECQARIRDHFHSHEQQLQRVSLAVTESRGHMPINHLLDKIKRMGDRAAQHQPQTALALTPPPPQPIKRKLIV